ncbi:MAG: CoA-binding protein [bacterium]
MMKTTRQAIDRFLAPKKLAVAGVSRDPKKFGNTVYKELKERGFEVYPINPNIDEVNGEKCYHSIAELPAGVRYLLVITKKPMTLGIVQEAVAKGIDHLWIQQMSETPEVMDFLKDKKVTLVTRECILMWIEPVKSIHKFHRCIRKIFGRLPE